MASSYSEVLPPFFYRVQRSGSKTLQHGDDSFESSCHDRQRFRHWVTREAFEKHLTWNNKEHSPFISVFDNEGEFSSSPSVYQ